MPHLIDFDTAIELMQALPVAQTVPESCLLSEAVGRVIAETVLADRDLPPFNRAAMDGYAFDRGSATNSMPVVGARRAGEVEPIDVPPGNCIGISTGAAVPASCDTVVQFEATDRGDPVCIEGELPAAGRHIHTQGSDAQSGDALINAGTRLGAAEIGIAAMVGRQKLAVRSVPRVALLTSGDEVVACGIDPASHQIRNSNGPMVTALVERLGGHVERHVHLQDDPDSTTGTIQRVVQSCDVIVTTGGISAGRHDYLPAALESLGCSWVISGVRMQPGKPIRIGVLGERIVVCLPGNPVSALVTAALFLGPVLRAYLGCDPALRWQPVTLAEGIKSNAARTLLRPATLAGPARVSVPPWQGSGDLVHTAGTDGLVRLPLSDRARAGDTASFTPWP